MRSLELLTTLLLIIHARASESVFNVHDDVFAFPQYDVTFSESYISFENARKKLRGSDPHKDPISSWDGDIEGQLARFHAQDDAASKDDGNEEDDTEYLPMTLRGASYLCAIPRIKEDVKNTTQSEEEEQPQTDLATAADRGWRLLEDMEGKPCLYYSTGWWSYSFCYNGEVTQFHALIPGVNGVRIWPPTEDPNTHSYILGKHKPKTVDAGANVEDLPEKEQPGQLETKAETSYLVQRLNDGTACDLTGKPRTIEVQFHCHPQSTDRIGWIKETSTCAYTMVVYTPRLCNDVAFLPPKAAQVNQIACQEILRPDQVKEWEARKSEEATRKMIGQGAGDKPRIVLGNVEVGGQKMVGSEGKVIERGRIVLTAEERAEIIMMHQDGQIHMVTNEQLKKLGVQPEELAKFQREIESKAGKEDWRIERIDEHNGQAKLRGIVVKADAKKPDKKGISEDPPNNEGGEEGSEEEYKEEI